MALVKFSAVMAKASAHWLTPTSASQENDEIGDRLQHAADPQAGRQRIAPRHEAAGKAADQRRGEADALDDGGIVVAREAEVDHERRGHRAGKRVGELEQHDEGERAPAHPCGSGIRRRRRSRRASRARTRVSAPCRGFGARRLLGLGRGQRGDDADQHQRRHRHIAPHPGRAARQCRCLRSR